MAMVRRFGPLKPRLEGNNRHIGILIKYLEVSISIFAVTCRKINIKPENTPLEEEDHLPNHHFQVLC